MQVGDRTGDRDRTGGLYLLNILFEDAMEAELTIWRRRWMSKHSVFSDHKQVRDLCKTTGPYWSFI